MREAIVRGQKTTKVLTIAFFFNQPCYRLARQGLIFSCRVS